MLLSEGRALPIALAAALGVGLAFGVGNGLLVAGLGIPPFVATLGTLGIAQGVALVVTDGQSVVGIGDRLPELYNSTLAGLPFSVLAAASGLRRASRRAVSHALRHLRVRHRRQPRGAGARGRAGDALSRRDLRARRADGRLRRAAADRPHELGPSGRRDWHGVRRDCRGDCRRHVVRARPGHARRHARRRVHGRRAQERPQRARSVVVSSGRQHRPARHRRAAGGLGAGQGHEDARLPPDRGCARRRGARAVERRVLHVLEPAQRPAAGEPDVPHRVGPDADDPHRRARPVGWRKRRALRLSCGDGDEGHRLDGPRRRHRPALRGRDRASSTG